MITEQQAENISIILFVLLITTVFITLAIILNHHNNYSNSICQSLGWKEYAGQCYCQNTTYNVNTGEAIIVKRQYLKELGCV